MWVVRITRTSNGMVLHEHDIRIVTQLSIRWDRFFSVENCIWFDIVAKTKMTWKGHGLHEATTWRRISSCRVERRLPDACTDEDGPNRRARRRILVFLITWRHRMDTGERLVRMKHVQRLLDERWCQDKKGHQGWFPLQESVSYLRFYSSIWIDNHYHNISFFRLILTGGLLTFGG